jgi:signal transduction histidine kinase
MKEFSHPGSEGKGPVDINKAIETTVTVSRNEWKYVADLETHLAADLPPVHCHAGQFNQVMLNLIVNAVDAIRQALGENSASKGKITITTSHQGEWAEISVRDTGTGIPEDVQPRIFEYFFTTKPVGKGTGQGLALAHNTIVKKHSGKIWFDTEPGRGTVFFIHLPLETSASAGA